MTLAYVAMGSNLGDRVAHLGAAVQALNPLKVSRYYETDALLLPGDSTPQPAFLNAVMTVDTNLEPTALLKKLREIEHHQGRPSIRERWQARTLDLDILLFGERVVEEPGLKIPHAEMHRRKFVLEPLCEIAPDAMHPVLKKSVRQLFEALRSVERSVLN